MELKLGRLPAIPGAIKLKFGDYLRAEALPPLPATFGHSLIMPPDRWGMFANDEVGDCVLAGAAHETMLWVMLGGSSTPYFSAANIKHQYLTLTGGHDTGLRTQTVAQWRQDVGLKDDSGRIHKIACSLSIDPSNLQHIMYGVRLFGAVGLGLALPAEAQEQFRNGEDWDFTSQDYIGGHYVSLMGRRPGMLHVITWGRRWPMTERSLTPDYLEEAVVYLSEEMLRDGKSPEGFDYAQLTADLAMLG